MARILKKVFIFAFAAFAAMLINFCLVGLCAPAPIVKQSTLDKIAKLPRNSSENPRIIVDLFLYDMGYPKNLIAIKYFNQARKAECLKGTIRRQHLILLPGNYI